MTGDIRGSYTEKLYQELEIEHLRSRRWFRKLSCFYKILNKILKNKPPLYLFNLITRSSRRHTAKNSDNITPFKVRHNSSKILFFPSVIDEWN